LKANYLVKKISSEIIVLRDDGPWDRYMTITNAAESVVEEINQHYGIGNRRLFYYDSEGELTELLVKDGRFVGFAPATEVKFGVMVK
jgi:hypothetical protein